MIKTAELSHLRPQEQAALKEYLERLEARFADRVLRVILFGSRARGEGDAESDLDVLVVVDEGDYDFHREVALAAFEPSLAHNALITPAIWNKARYERQKREGLLFFRNLERDGIPLWTKPIKSRQLPKDSRAPKTILKQRG